jgi:hemoglobin/transferrin/lactoferrin receptor protein
VHNWQYLERQRASIRWNYTPMAKWVDSVDTHAYWQHSGSTNDSDSAAKPLVIGGMPIPGTGITRQQSIEFTTDIVGLSSIAKKEIAPGGSWSQLLMVGLDLSQEDGENRFERVNTGTPEDRVSFAPSETFRAGIFFQDEIRLGEKWFITPGLRFDWQKIDPNPSAAYLERIASFSSSPVSPPEEYENLAISPRLNIAFKPRETMQWYASYAHGVRNPSAEELSMIFSHPNEQGGSAGTTTVPNPDLTEEKSDAFEVGFKAQGEMGRFQAASYYSHYSDFIENGVPNGQMDGLKPVVTTVNRGKTEIYGFEIGGVWEAGSLWSEARGWQLGLSTGKSVGINRSEDTWLNTIEPWKTAAFIGYDDPEGRFGARFTGIYMDDVTRVDDTSNQGTFYRPPSWFTLDLGVYWRPQETLTINAGLNNIFDEKYWNWGSVRRGNGHLGGNSVTERSTAPGRNFSISLTKIF